MRRILYVTAARTPPSTCADVVKVDAVDGNAHCPSVLRACNYIIPCWDSLDDFSAGFEISKRCFVSVYYDTVQYWL